MPKRNYAEYAEKDLRKTAPGRQNQTQSRTTGMMRQSSDFDTIEQIDPFTQMESNPKGTKVHRCVEKVKRQSGGNAYAICQKSTGQSYKTGRKL